MLRAIFADQHGNIHGLKAILDDIEKEAEKRGQEIKLTFLGDHVGHGPKPVECLDTIAELGDQVEVSVQGNNEAAVLQKLDNPDIDLESLAISGNGAFEGIHYTIRQLAGYDTMIPLFQGDVDKWNAQSPGFVQLISAMAAEHGVPIRERTFKGTEEQWKGFVEKETMALTAELVAKDHASLIYDRRLSDLDVKVSPKPKGPKPKTAGDYARLAGRGLKWVWNEHVLSRWSPRKYAQKYAKDASKDSLLDSEKREKVDDYIKRCELIEKNKAHLKYMDEMPISAVIGNAVFVHDNMIKPSDRRYIMGDREFVLNNCSPQGTYKVQQAFRRYKWKEQGRDIETAFIAHNHYLRIHANDPLNRGKRIVSVGGSLPREGAKIGYVLWDDQTNEIITRELDFDWKPVAIDLVKAGLYRQLYQIWKQHTEGQEK